MAQISGVSTKFIWSHHIMSSGQSNGILCYDGALLVHYWCLVVYFFISQSGWFPLYRKELIRRTLYAFQIQIAAILGKVIPNSSVSGS